MSNRTPEAFKQYVYNACEQARIVVNNFATKLLQGENPAYHAEWSGGFFAASATLQILSQYEEGFKRIQEGAPSPFDTEAEMMKEIKRSIMRDLIFRAEYAANQSTSPTRNLLELHKTQVLGKAAEFLGLKSN
jgi:hypothetical protein